MSENSSQSLPSDFAEFQKFIDWSLPTESARRRRRFREVTYDEVKSFYDFCHESMPSGKTRTEEALEYLDGFPLDKMPEPEKKLFNILLSFAEITSTVEAWGETNPSTITPYEIFTTHPDTDEG